MKWFGEDWNAQVCANAEHTQVPVGKPCLKCEKTFQDGDRGFTFLYSGRASDPTEVYFHRECFLEVISLFHRRSV